jgi:hypothetical protein
MIDIEVEYLLFMAFCQNIKQQHLLPTVLQNGGFK